MAARLTASEGSPKGLAPLYLGTEHRTHLTAEAGYEFATITGLDTEPIVLTKRGAGALARWLYSWSRPRSRMKLWGIDGIVQECKVSRATAWRWSKTQGFPKPLDVVGGNGPVWEADAVKAWVKLARPKTGRPRKQKDPARQ